MLVCVLISWTEQQLGLDYYLLMKKATLIRGNSGLGRSYMGNPLLAILLC